MSLAQLFEIKETWRQRIKRARHEWLRSRHALRASRLTLESLEPRVLLNGAPTPLTPEQLALDGATTGQVATGDPRPSSCWTMAPKLGAAHWHPPADIQPQS